ncbi:MAG: tyrosine-type recombinase/integrase, partial [Sulfurimicrobium sp.]|nr:tyrosine-type recombinase/integrase [Sulfurimicrobium sp.]
EPKHVPPSEWLFPGQAYRRPIDVTSIQTAFRMAWKSSGISKRATVHTLRHYAESRIMPSNLEYFPISCMNEATFLSE